MVSRGLMFIHGISVLACALQIIQAQDVTVTHFNYHLSAAKLFWEKDLKVYFDVTIENGGTVQIEDVYYPATNFDADILLSDASLEAGPENPTTIQFPATFDVDDHVLRRSLVAGGTLSLTGQSLVNVPMESCLDVTHLCIQIKKGSGATYADASSLNNYHCLDVQSTMACTDDSVDLSIRFAQLIQSTVRLGQYLSVELLLQVELYGSTTVDPSQGDAYSITAYLSIDEHLDQTNDLQLSELPQEFERVATTEFSTEGYLELSGSGLILSSNASYCGPVYLILHVDGQGGVPGQIAEPDEENNIRALRLVLLCEGDQFGLRDFDYHLATNQEELFEGASTPVWVSASVFNTNPNHVPFQPGPANFKLMLWLSETQDIDGALEVTEVGVKYSSVESSPQVGLATGDSVTIEEALVWIDGDKFSAGTRTNKRFLILQVDTADGSTWVDRIQTNNYEALPVAVSSQQQSGQIDFILDPYLEVSQNLANGEIIVADGSVKPVTTVSSTKVPQDGNTFSLVSVNRNGDPDGHMIYPPGFNLGTMSTKLYWSADEVFEPETDELSTFKLTQSSFRGKGYIQAIEDVYLHPPDNKNLCGVVHAIVHIDVANNNRESLEHNNVASDIVRLQCHPDDMLGLTAASYYKVVPSLWEGVASRLYLSVDVSCTETICDKNGTTESFQLKLHLVTNAKDEQVELLSISSNEDIDDVTNGGLNAVFQGTSLRQRVTFSAEVTVTTANCLPKYTLLGISLHPGDVYTDNDVIYLELPQLLCGQTDAIDLVPTKFSIDGPVLHTSQRIPFSLEVDVQITGTSLFVNNDWPVFQFSLSLHDVDSDVTMEIPYTRTDCQYEELTKQYTTTSTLTLDDNRGFIIPDVGFETFCESSIKVLVTIDTYDPDPSDDIIGEILETLETNNVKYTESMFTLDTSRMDCSNYLDVNIPRLGSQVIHFEGPEYVWEKQETTFNIELAVINIYSAPIRGGSPTSKDFTVQAYLSGDAARTDDDQHFSVRVSNTEVSQQYMGMEAGGMAVFHIEATLCQTSTDGCVDENVLDETECLSLQGQQPQILFGVGEIRTELDQAGYRPELNSHQVLVKCMKSVSPVIDTLAYTGTIYADHTYAIPFRVNVINYTPHNPSNLFGGDEPKYLLQLYLSNNNDTSELNGANTLALTVVNTVENLPGLDTVIDPGGSLTLESTAELEVSSVSGCSALESVTLYLKAEVKIPTGGIFHNNVYQGGVDVIEIQSFTVQCSTDHVDLAVALFSLDNRMVTWETPVEFDLNVDITTSGSASFSSGAANYAARFYLSFDAHHDGEDTLLSSPFGSSQEGQMSSAVTTSQTVSHTLGSTGSNDALRITSERGAKYCFERDVYILIQLAILDGSVEPDHLNNVEAVPVSLLCEGDLFLLESASVHPLELMADNSLEMFLDVTIGNSHPDQVDIPHSVNGEDLFYLQLYTEAGTLIPLASIAFPEEDSPKLKASLPVNETVSVNSIRLEAIISTVLCTEIQTTSSLKVRVRHGLGLADGLTDALPENDFISFDTVTCSENTADLYVESFQLTGQLMPATGAFGSHSYELDIGLSLGGSRSFPGGPDKHFAFDIWLSHDNKLDISLDKPLLFETDGITELKRAYNQAENSINIQQTGDFGIIYPKDVQENYCGRSFLIVAVDIDDAIIETQETNNYGTSEVFLDCENDVYDLESVEIHSQSVYHPDLSAAFSVSFSVYNVLQSGASVIQTDSSDNYRLVLYTQIGPEFDPKSATKISDAWIFPVSEESEQLRASLDHHNNHVYTTITTEVILSESLCNIGVDHLIFEVESVELSECLRYNNFYAHPISCGGSDTVDIRVNQDRNNLPIFELIGGNMITLGEPKSFALKIMIDVQGEGGWAMRSIDEGPVFSYEFLLSDGSTSLVVVHEPKVAEINAATTMSRVIDLGGSLNLTLSDGLLLCQSELQLTVLLDPQDQLQEYNELNNQQTITMVAVTDGGTGQCDSGSDLSPHDLQLEPFVSLTIEMGATFDCRFSFTVHTGQSASEITGFDYSLFLTGEVWNHDNYVEIEGSDGTHAVASGSEVMVKGLSVPADQLDLHQFCQGRPYLGVKIVASGGVVEVDTENNMAWTPVLLTCPGIYALGISAFSLNVSSSKLVDYAESLIIFSVKLLNKGQTVEANTNDNFNFNVYLSSSDDPDVVALETPLVATFEGIPDPDRKSVFESGVVREYANAVTKFTLTTADCVGQQYLCVELVLHADITDDPGDNIVCVDVLQGPLVLDCARDVSVDSLTYSYVTSDIFQDTAVPLTFDLSLTFTGQKVSSSESPHIGFGVYLSDRNDLVPDSLNNGAQLRIDTEAETDASMMETQQLIGTFSNGDMLSVQLTTEVMVTSASCATTGRFVCVAYTWLSELTPAVRDSDSTNDFLCQDVTSDLACHNDTKDLEPVWLSFAQSGIVPVNQPVNFDLQVKVSLRGTGTEGVMSFGGAFYLSTMPDYDNTAEEIIYNGFTYGTAAAEMTRYLMGGEHVLNLGGIGLNITRDTVLNPQLCGAAFVLYKVDHMHAISERYETNNMVAAPILLQCPGDILRLEVTNFVLPDGLWPDANHCLVTFDAVVQNMGSDLPPAKWGSKNYRFELYASDSDTWGTGNQTLITKEVELKMIDSSLIDGKMTSAMKTGESQWLPGIKIHTTGGLLELSSCPSLTHILVCVTHHRDTEVTTFTNNCQAQRVEPDDLHFEPNSAQTDVWLSSLRLPRTLRVPSSITVQHDIGVRLGSAAGPLDAGDLISGLYLSAEPEWKPETAYKVADLINAVAQPAGSYSVNKVITHEVMIPSLADHRRLCGKVYAHILVDSEGDLAETSESNNVGHAPVMVLCDADYFGLSDVHLAIPDGSLIEDIPVQFSMLATITCSHENCNVPMAAADNVILHMTSNIGDQTSHDFPDVTSNWWNGDTGSVHVPPRFWNSRAFGVTNRRNDNNKILDEHLMQLVTFWDGGEMMLKQSDAESTFTAGYPEPGYSRVFAIHGSLTLPVDKCAESGVNNITVSVDFGSALDGEIDGVQDNNVITLPVQCKPGGARDLIASPIEFWSHDPDCPECLPVLPTMPLGELVLYNIAESTNAKGLTSPGVSEVGESKTHSNLAEFLSTEFEKGQPKPLHYSFSLAIQLTGESIPGIDAMPNAAPFTIGLFLSHDPVWSHDDISLQYKLSESTAGDLRLGLTGGATLVLQEFVQGVTLPSDVCGYQYVIVHIDDTNRIQETSETNNFAATRVFIDCATDIFEMTNLYMNGDSANTYWQGHTFTLTFDVALQYTSSHVLMNDGPTIELQTYLSVDEKWDPLEDVLLDSEIQERDHGAFDPGAEIYLTSVALNGSITSSDCTQGMHFVIVVALPYGEHMHTEATLHNNWKALPLNVQCGGEVDLSVNRVSMGSQTSLNPGDVVTQLNVQIQQHDPDSSLDDVELTVDLWISRDQSIDPRFDIAVEFNVGQTTFTLPEDIDFTFCGRVFLLAHVDPRNEIPELDETNNVGLEEFIVKCLDDVLSVHSLKFATDKKLVLDLAIPLSLEVRVECTLPPFGCPPAPADPGQVHFSFKVKVYDKSGYELGDVTPSVIDSAWVSNVENDDDEFTMFSQEDGLRKSFKSIHEFQLTIQDHFQLADPGVCEQVGYIGLEMVKGDSEELSNKPDWSAREKVALAPVVWSCVRSTVDLSVTSFTLAEMTLNMTLGDFKVTDLTVDVTSDNMPSGSTGKPLFDFSYLVTGVEYVTGPKVVNLNIQHSASVINTLLRDWTSSQLTLTQPEVKFNTALIRHMCGHKAQIKVSLDSKNLVMETNETNNEDSVNITVSGCEDGIDQKIRELTAPSLVYSGETVILDMVVDTVLVGPVGVVVPDDLTQQRYLLQLSLIDSLEDAQREFQLPMDVSHLTELREDLAPDSTDTAQSGIATVHSHHLVDISVTIPPDFVLCGRSWFLKAEVMMHNGIAALELYREDNVVVRHMHILCPEDQLALLSIEVISFPPTWWSESTNEIHLYAHVINTGSDIINPAASSYSIKQYFSLDNELDINDAELMLYDDESRPYAYSGDIPTGHVISSGLLKGELKIDSKSICDEAKQSAAVPTLFWKLEASNSTWTADLKNDVMKKMIDKSTLVCNTNNLDLTADELHLLGTENSLSEFENIEFSFHYKIHKTATASIPASDFQSTDVSIKVEFFLSNDAVLGADDVSVEMTYTSEQLNILQHGIAIDSQVEDAYLEGDNLHLPATTYPEYAFYCGKSFLLVQITDLMNIDIDPVPENNLLATPITLKCPGDLLSFESLSMSLVPPQTYLYHTTPTKFALSALIKSYSEETIADSRTDGPIFEIRAFMSEDAVLDVIRDPEIVFQADSTLENQFKFGFDPLEEKLYEGFVELFVPEVTCVCKPKYLILLIQKYSHLSIEDAVVSNDYQYIPLNNLFRCTKKHGDLWIQSFNLTNSDQFEPDGEISFVLQLQANLYGETRIAVKGVFDVNSEILMPLDFQFFLSHDQVFDTSDYNIGYDLLSNPKMRELYDMKTVVTVAHSLYQADHMLTLPKTTPAEYCGHVYILAVVDPWAVAEEVNEHNNHQAILMHITCYHDVFEVLASVPQTQVLYQEGPGLFQMSLILFNALSEPISEEMGNSYVDIKFYVQSTKHPSSTLHDITPSEILNSAGLPLNRTETIEPMTDHSFGFLEAFINVGEACNAGLDPIESGTVRLLVDLRPGSNTQLQDYVDSVPENNQVWTDIEVLCGGAQIDLSVKDMDMNLVKFGPMSGRLEFGENPFQFVVSAVVSEGAGWPLSSSDPDSPAMFTYTFLYSITVAWQNYVYQTSGMLPYNMQSTKHIVNNETTADRDINLSDLSSGWVLERSHFLFLCLMDPELSDILVSVNVDDMDQVLEVNEGNNQETISLKPPTQETCTAGSDFSVNTWRVLNNQYDIVRTDVTYGFELKLLLVLIEDVLNDLEGTEDRHFAIEFYLSHDLIVDEEDVSVEVDWDEQQLAALQMHATNLGFMDLSGSNLYIPLSNETYTFCWRNPYLLVYADSQDTKQEVNEDNNVAGYQIVLDCGTEVDECRTGYHDCHESATCTDLQYHLYSTGEQGYLCQCNQGYTGNGTYCENINECEDLTQEGLPMHNCDAEGNSVCRDLIGSFECTCLDGHTSSDDVIELCVNINECEDGSHTCDENAECVDNIGSYSCTCLDGFEGDGINCTNIDDCMVDSCLNGGVCRDGVNTVMCTCAVMYEGEQCEIANGNWSSWGEWGACIAECGPGLRKRERRCDNPEPSNGGRGCLMESGVGSLQEELCQEPQCESSFDWCLTDPCNQDNGGRCLPKNQGNDFVCSCEKGYRRLEDGTGVFLRCDDIDECTEESHDCSLVANCTNTLGGYTCTCAAGYHGNGQLCEDIDECSEGTSECDVNADCENTAITYSCLCQDGYKEEKQGDPLTGKCLEKRLYDYGLASGDVLVETVSDITGERLSSLIVVPHGLPLEGGTILNALYISENGILVGTDDTVTHMNRPTYTQPRDFNSMTLDPSRDNLAIIAPFFADVKTETNVSQIWYQSYTDTSHELFTKVQTMLEQTIDVNQPMRFLLKVTWYKMQPNYETNASEFNTFQAIVATDYTHTYFLFVYDAGEMTWNPVYTTTDIYITYKGYPAWIGLISLKPDGSMYRPPQDLNSGEWSTAANAPNAYRVDSKTSQAHNKTGVLVFRGFNEDNAVPLNPRVACVDWYQSEESPSVWASDLLGNCPSTVTQAQQDPRFVTSTGCYTRKFTLQSGSNLRCCYEGNSGSLVTALNTNNGAALNSYTEAGFIHRYQQDGSPSSSHSKLDVQPFEWCCLQAKSYSSHYCDWYLEKRPMASSQNYDKLALATVYGDPHFVTLDGLAYTYSGFGEYVLLMSQSSAPLYMMLQARTDFLEMYDEPKMTKLRALSIQVGSTSSPVVQFYLKDDSETAQVEVYIDNLKITATAIPDPPGIQIDMDDSAQPTWAKILFKEGIWIHIVANKVEMQGLLKATVAMPTSFHGGHYRGLLGSFDGDVENDLVTTLGTTLVEKASEASSDQMGVWANSWSLRLVYGQFETGANARDKSLFSQYPSAHPDALSYYYLNYNPAVFAQGDFTEADNQLCSDGLTYSHESIHDYEVTNSSAFGLATLQDKLDFMNLKSVLDNVSPQFTSTDLDTLHLTLNVPILRNIKVSDLHDPGEVTVRASVKDSSDVEELDNTHLVVTNQSTGIHTAYFEWTPTRRNIYTIELTATDSHCASTTLKPFIILCACDHDASCDFTKPSIQLETFAYAACVCPAGRSGDFCTENLDACVDNPCYTEECRDLSPEMAQLEERQFLCGACPEGMEGDGVTCVDLNQCIQPEGSENRHQCEQLCINTAVDRGYTCTCLPGFQLSTDDLGCDDIKECVSPSLNDCDWVHGYCLDDIPGSYTCHCNSGYDHLNHTCVDRDECLVNNGGCHMKCINTEGSYHCDCSPGFTLSGTGHCVDVNECELFADCAQECVNHAGYYECQCRVSFTLHTDGKTCLPINPCIELICDPRAFCGIDDIIGAERCFCPLGTMNHAGDISVCMDVDECGQNKHECDMNGECVNTYGGYECRCKDGYQQHSTNPKRCEDIDECLGETRCEQLCVNSGGNYSCQCHRGYMLNKDGNTCTDLDECGMGQQNECSPLANCVNTNGSYTCHCQAGFTGSGFVCHDVDECLTENGGCSMQCDNNYGSYSCSCVTGYKQHPSDHTRCADIDECNSPGIACDHLCTNTQGSFTCRCRDGFTLVGTTTCQATSPCEERCGGGLCYYDDTMRCMCKDGYTQRDILPLDECVDVDECELGSNRCDTSKHAHCENLEGDQGRYHCVCEDGYTLNMDRISCSDVDECRQRTDDCDSVSQTCRNTFGGYQCDCKAGFFEHNATHCQDVDECSRHLHDCVRKVAECNNTPGGYVCLCKSGYQGNGKTCTDVNECVDPDANTCDAKTQVCVNSIGSYSCGCQTGYKWDFSTQQCVDIDECSSPILNDCEDKGGCINRPGSHHCSCYDGAVLANDGRTCPVLNPCTNPSQCTCGNGDSECLQLCVKIENTDTCFCRYPYEMVGGVCQEINECLLTNAVGQFVSPCNTSNSSCVNKPAHDQFECQCHHPYLPDVDGLGCSETDGLWSPWSALPVCSRSCSGRQVRRRTCSNPPPQGEGRMCTGDDTEYRMCNQHCESMDEETEAGISLTFSGLPVYHWETVEASFEAGVTDGVNEYCLRNNFTYSQCCRQKILQEDMPVRKYIITRSDIRVVTGYPVQYGHSNSQVALYVVVQDENQLCTTASTRQKRHVSENSVSRIKRDIDITENRTYSLLDQSVLEEVLNDSDTWTAIQEYLDDDDLLDTYGLLSIYLVSDAVPVTTTMETMPETAPESKGLVLWMILVIAGGCLVVLILLVFVIVLLHKRNKEADIEAENSSRPSSVVSRKNFENEAESDEDSISLSGSNKTESSFAASRATLQDNNKICTPHTGPIPAYMFTAGDNRIKDKQQMSASSDQTGKSSPSYKENDGQGRRRAYKENAGLEIWPDFGVNRRQANGQDIGRNDIHAIGQGFREEHDDESTPEPESRPISRTIYRGDIESRASSTLPGATMVDNESDSESEPEEKPKKKLKKKRKKSKSEEGGKKRKKKRKPPSFE